MQCSFTGSIHVPDKVDWETAYKRCESNSDSLVSIQDILTPHSPRMEYTSIWSSVKGYFTPWIAYKGK